MNNNNKGTLSIVVGGQFGSEGKGAVAGWLARSRPTDIAVRVAGPNAGHSAMDADGKVWALRCIPVMAVTNPLVQLVLAPGSEIDEKVLMDEIAMLEEGGISIVDRLHIDWQATVLTDDHIRQESGGDINARLGSTAKGIGAARADRIWRQAAIWGTEEFNAFDDESVSHPCGIQGEDTIPLVRYHLAQPSGHVVIEGTQGFGLGLHAGFYPQCTSSDARAVDFAAMAGITPWADAGQVDTWVVLRTHPIRVAGNSGPMKDETTWENLERSSGGYIHAERTTVTKKVRRVGGWDPELAAQAVAANGGDACKIALTFFDYWFPELAGSRTARDLTTEHMLAIDMVERETGAKVCYLGTSPGDGISIP